MACEVGSVVRMKAVLYRSSGGPASSRVEDVPALPTSAGHVRVRAAGVNFANTLMGSGKYRMKPPLPFTPELKVGGEIMPGVTDLRVGQMVMAFLRDSGSMRAEEVIPVLNAVAISDAIDFITTAAVPAVYGTAWFALTHRGKLRAGENLLVLGAASGVELAAVEVGKLLGTRVLAAAGGAAKGPMAHDHGAQYIIYYNNKSIRDRVCELTGGKVADVVFDPVGGDAFDQTIRAINWETRMLVIGFAAGRTQALTVNLISIKNISAIGVVWGAQQERDLLFANAWLWTILGYYGSPFFRPLIGMIYLLEQVGTAIAALLSRQIPGKIVLMA
ncbi:MAG: NADPH:quinone oxidoreductase family protein [Acetobacteraceae bacterium]|nr:NADPH:quinone oxidoreductase family protein [Acetobacteraceae bacterium]MSP31190.1 NADPH:quinone oxidoreductase family protein [Acetobacteraceae bacterium]